MRKITLAAGQFEVVNDIDRNLESIRQLSRSAAKEGARIIVFPECAVTGGLALDVVDMTGLTPENTRAAARRLGEIAKECGIYIASGSMLPSDGLLGWHNVMIVYSDKGENVCTYAKRVLTPTEQAYFDEGTEDPVFEVDGLLVGCQVCFDVRLPEGYRRLLRQDVDIILHCYHQCGGHFWAEKREIMRAFQRVRAGENGVYVVAANTTGHPGKEQWMTSMIVNPAGETAGIISPGQTGYAIATIDGDDLVQEIETEIRRLSLQVVKGKQAVPAVAA